MVHDDAPEYNFDPFFPLSGADRAHVWRDLGGVDAQCAMGSVPSPYLHFDMRREDIHLDIFRVLYNISSRR